MSAELRPALRLAADRLESALRHLTAGVQWVHGTSDEEGPPASGFYFVCARDFLQEAADIVALFIGDNEGACDRCGVRVATDDDYCAGCYDIIGERQAERASS